MSLTVRARYEKSVVEPLESIDLEDGEEVIIVIKKRPNIDKFIRSTWQG